jgi:hypothetical protein
VVRRYTDQQFRDAVADPEVRTIADLCRALGIVPRGGNYESVRAHALDLGLDLDQLLAGRSDPTPRPTGRRTWRDEQLLEALADPMIDGYPALCERLGLQPYHNTYRRLREHALRLGSPIPRDWSVTGPRGSSRRGATGLWFDEDALREAVAASRTRREVLERLGQPVTATTYGRLSADLRRAAIDLRAGQRRRRIGWRPSRDHRAGTSRRAVASALQIPGMRNLAPWYIASTAAASEDLCSGLCLRRPAPDSLQSIPAERTAPSSTSERASRTSARSAKQRRMAPVSTGNPDGSQIAGRVSHLLRT